MIRRVLIVVGVVAATGGIALVLVPQLGLFGGRSILVVLAAVALVQGIRVVLDRRGHVPDVGETPDPETEQDLQAPGDELDEALARVGRRAPGSVGPRGARRAKRRRETVRERIESAAVQTIVRRHGCTHERARRAMETGEWTDDPDAAALFTGKAEGIGTTERIRRLFGTEPPFARRARRAAIAVGELAEAETVEELPPVDPSESEERERTERTGKEDSTF